MTHVNERLRARGAPPHARWARGGARAAPLPLATYRRRACRSMHLARRQAARFDRAVRIGMSFGR
ncbi:unnamed protein product [Burkholderia pseudomallei]|nr:unnamed protein product [Burkholderia pseudomallei]